LTLTHTPIQQDKNAVKVARQTGKQIGWLHAEVAKKIAPLLDRNIAVDAEITDISHWINGARCTIRLTCSRPIAPSDDSYEATLMSQAKAKKKGGIITAVVVIALVGSCAFMMSRPGTPSKSTSSSPSLTRVEYEITGSARSVDVTLNNATGGTEQYSDVPVPYEYTYSNFTDDFLYVSAQNNGELGSVTVSIYRNGSKIKAASSSGAYVIATASAGN
jgi:hypothetical protein